MVICAVYTGQVQLVLHRPGERSRGKWGERRRGGVGEWLEKRGKRFWGNDREWGEG